MTVYASKEVDDSIRSAVYEEILQLGGSISPIGMHLPSGCIPVLSYSDSLLSLSPANYCLYTLRILF